jgi:predicted nucleic acid-binding protein
MATKTRVFLDTNILVYQFDRSAPAKQRRAEEIIKQCITEENAVISSQVVQEFMNVALKKFAAPLSVEDLEAVTSSILEPFCAHFPTFEFYERTLKLFASNSISFYDALIIQAAIDLDCNLLYSEDLQDGRKFGVLRIKNPFV